MDLKEFRQEFTEVGNRRISALVAKLPSVSNAEAREQKLALHAKIRGITDMMDTFDELWELLD